MTDRINGLIVTLDRDYREDDIEVLITTIGLLKGVLDVRPLVTDVSDHVNRMRIRHELEAKLWEALRDKEGGG